MTECPNCGSEEVWVEEDIPKLDGSGSILYMRCSDCKFDWEVESP